jgi:hypothetical protein
MVLSMGQHLPEWGNDLTKMMAYGHVSAYYLFHKFSKGTIVFILMNLLSVIYAGYYYSHEKENSVEDEALRKLFLIVFIVMALYITYFILVDVLNVFFFMKFAFLRIGWYLSLIYIIFLAYGLQIVQRRRFEVGKGLINKIFVSCLILMALSTSLTIARRIVLIRMGRNDKYWKDICIAANKLPENSRFLVPYLKIDFYRYANRISVFNRYYAGFLLADRSIFNDIKEKYDDFIYEGFLREFVDKVKRKPEDLQKMWWETIQNRWSSLTLKEIMELRKKYEITHVIRERVLPLDLPVVYQNKRYCMYYIAAGKVRANVENYPLVHEELWELQALRVMKF